MEPLEKHKNTLQRIGNRIAYYRKQKKLSQAELARSIGISLSYLGKIERADLESFAVITLLDIADALGVPPKALMTEDEY